jgi:hypothetical protein
MKQVTLYFWRLKNERTGKPFTTKYRMSSEEAAARGEVGEPLEPGKIVIEQPETPEDEAAAYRPSRHSQLADPKG